MYLVKPSLIKTIVVFLAGAVYALGFAPFDYSIVAIFSVAVLFYNWLSCSPESAFKIGFIFGLGQFFVGISWIYVSLHDFAGAGVLMAVLMNALFAAMVAVFSGLPGTVAVVCASIEPLISVALVFPASWIFFEWLRTWILSGFPWLQIGYSQIDTLMGSFAPVAGVFGVGFVASVFAGLGVAVWVCGKNKRWVILGVFAGIIGLAALLSNITWTQPAGAEFQATLIQANISQELKWAPDSRAQTLRIYADMTDKHWDSRVIVWPETAVPVFYHDVKDNYLADLESKALRSQTDLLIGVPLYDSALKQSYNALVSLGQNPGRYLKRHLVPFGEYLPLQPVSGFIAEILDFPMANFSAGEDNQAVLTAAGFPLAASICYEDVFGHESLVFLPEALYLVNLTNDAWFADSLAPHQHLQMARMRALETGRYMLRATNNGISAIISDRGKVVAVAPQFKRTTLTGSIIPMSGSTPYIRFGDYPVIVMLGLVLIIARFYARKGGQNLR